MNCPICGELLRVTPNHLQCRSMHSVMVTGGLHTSENILEDIHQYMCNNRHIIYLSAKINYKPEEDTNADATSYTEAMEIIKSVQ